MSSKQCTKGISFGPDGCQVIVDGKKCGETRTLNIIQEFKCIYERKLKEIDTRGGGDGNLKAKISLQEQWIKDLSEQNEMMVKAIEELEIEATDRVQMLEDKLEESAKCICEVMKRYQDYNYTLNLDEPFQKTFYLKNDIKNLVEFVRRVREDNCWNIDGLTFYEVGYNDLFGSKCSNATIPLEKSCKTCFKPNPCEPPCNTENETVTNDNCDEVTNEKVGEKSLKLTFEIVQKNAAEGKFDSGCSESNTDNQKCFKSACDSLASSKLSPFPPFPSKLRSIRETIMDRPDTNKTVCPRCHRKKI